ncbi:unnamed protein product, partial [Acanthoscelides obtectus]
MNSEAFYEYVANVFYPWLQNRDTKFPVALFLDGHNTSHISLALSEFCKEKGIVLVALLPNSTHILQPLDVAVFRPVKATWRNVVHDFRFKNEGAKIRRSDFSNLVKACFEKCLKQETIKKGFECCGLFPFNPESINYSKLMKTYMQEQQEPVCNNTKDQNVTGQTDHHFKEQLEAHLPLATLELFKSSGDTWNGDLTYEKLFVFWKSLQDKPSAETDMILDDTTIINNITENIRDFDANAWDTIDLEIQGDGNLSICNIEYTENCSLPGPSVTLGTKNSNALRTIEKTYNTPDTSPVKILPHDNILIDEHASENDTNLDVVATTEKPKENPMLPVGETAEELMCFKVSTPFKNAFYFPKKVEDSAKQRATRKITPVVAISDEFMEYQRRIKAEKEKKQHEKEQRKSKKVTNHLLKKRKLNPEDNSEKNVEKKISNYNIGDHVITIYEGELFPGVVCGYDENGIMAGITVKSMEMSGPNWKWLEKDDILTYDIKDILCKIEPPELINSRGIYNIPK